MKFSIFLSITCPYDCPSFMPVSYFTGSISHEWLRDRNFIVLKKFHNFDDFKSIVMKKESFYSESIALKEY